MSERRVVVLTWNPDYDSTEIVAVLEWYPDQHALTIDQLNQRFLAEFGYPIFGSERRGSDYGPPRQAARLRAVAALEAKQDANDTDLFALWLERRHGFTPIAFEEQWCDTIRLA